MFDPEIFAVGDVPLLVLVFGLTEFFKSMFNMEGKTVTALSAGMGVLVMVAYSLVGVVPEPYGQVLTIIVQSLTLGLSASGYYKFVNKRAPVIEYLNDDNDPDPVTW